MKILEGLENEHPDHDAAKLSLAELRREITVWEQRHIKENGGMFCNNPHCMEIYKYFRNVYSLRYRREKLKMNNTFFLEPECCSVFSCYKRGGKTVEIKHTMFAEFNSTFVEPGDTIKIEEYGVQLSYQILEIDKINPEAFKAVVKIIDVKSITS